MTGSNDFRSGLVKLSRKVSYFKVSLEPSLQLSYIDPGPCVRLRQLLICGSRSARSGIVNCAPQRIYSPPLSSFLVSSRVHPRYASGLSTDAPAAGGETPISPPQQQPILRTNKKRVTRPPHRLKSMGKGVQFYNNSGQMKGFSKAKNL